MKIRVGLLCATLAATVITAAPALALECKTEAISATSREYVSRSIGAFPGSWAAWRNEVKERLGDGWQAWRRAEDRKIDCKQVDTAGGAKRWTCTRTAKPCKPGGSDAKDPTTPPVKYEPIDQVLRRGMQNEQVKTLQYLLKEAGFDVTIDGDFGRTTEDALRKFQKSSGITVDGRAGPKTIEALTS